MTKRLSRRISESRRSLQNPYAYLNDLGVYDAVPSISRNASESALLASVETIREHALKDRARRNELRYSYAEIEKIARRLQNLIWKHRHEIWPAETPSNPKDILDPKAALRAIGYDCDLGEPLGRFAVAGQMAEVGGIIDGSLKKVRISPQFPANTQNFTAAHELGHALLHNAQGLHRDRPLDGSKSGSSRESVELEADKFATYFLMPGKLVKTAFVRSFGADPFSLNDDTLFALSPRNSEELREKFKTLRDLSKFLAVTEYYNRNYFKSLANQFRVSPEAMAIRLEELGLLER